MPWLILAIGATVALEAIARGASRGWSGALGRESARLARAVGAVVGLVALAFALGLAGLELPAAPTGAPTTRATTTSTRSSTALPPDAAILSYWDASTPLWHAKYVEGRRPDVLIVDDTNIVYEGWGTREARIASLICERPVFILRLDPRDSSTLASTTRLTRLLDGPGRDRRPVGRHDPRDLPGRAARPVDLSAAESWRPRQDSNLRPSA